MDFEIKFSKSATKFLRSLDECLLDRIKLKLKEVAKSPFRFLEHFEGKNYFKLRVGDFRALIDVELERRILFVRVFDKRGRIYKR